MRRAWLSAARSVASRSRSGVRGGGGGVLLRLALGAALHSSLAAGDCAIEPAHALDLARSLRPARSDAPLPRLAGSVVLVVNTASQCGYAPQVASLQALHARYRARGLVVLGVPSNSFGAQEPGASADVPALYAARWGAAFPLTAITPVTGGDAHALYLHLQHKLGDAGAVAWNFHKYLFDGSGDLIGVFGPSTDPLEDDVVAAIEDALDAHEQRAAAAAARTDL